MPLMEVCLSISSVILVVRVSFWADRIYCGNGVVVVHMIADCQMNHE